MAVSIACKYCLGRHLIEVVIVNKKVSQFGRNMKSSTKTKLMLVND